MNGWNEGSDMSATLWWDPTLASHIALLALVTTPIKNAGAIILPATPIYGGSSTTSKTIGFVTAGIELTPKLDMEKAVSLEIKAEIDGVPTVT